MLNGMSTIEIIENLKIEKFDRKSGDTTIRMIADELSLSLDKLSSPLLGIRRAYGKPNAQ